ncbi:hypothetical protein MCUN1_000925 [Malassezia cuniculi]|uniref:Tetratricopeptide repeat protein n=1 Tax=Malassezia cuniculi TaxID=948313 RepID=A0AAF0J5D0_9BASI|nr:hypothetical protein MCUN1_000925 [Malassezia cuniculi]
MDTTRKVEIGTEFKDKGNAAFVKGDYTGALREYYHAVLYLSGLDRQAVEGLGGAQPAEKNHEADKQLGLVRSNMAACYLQQGRYDRAVDAAEKALKIDESNQKAIFRKAQALRLRGDLHAAQDFLKSDTARPFADHPDFIAEAARVAAAIRSREQKSAAALRGFLR